MKQLSPIKYFLLGAAFLVLAGLGVIAYKSIISRRENFFAAVLPGLLIDLTNQERSQSGITDVKQNDLLTQAAQLKANDMAAKGYFSHVTPEGNTPWYWIEKTGYAYSAAGENLAVNFFDSKEVAEAWMKSPTHRENVLKGKYTEIGIATAEGNYKGQTAVFVVEFLATPK